MPEGERLPVDSPSCPVLFAVVAHVGDVLALGSVSRLAAAIHKLLHIWPPGCLTHGSLSYSGREVVETRDGTIHDGRERFTAAV